MLHLAPIFKIDLILAKLILFKRSPNSLGWKPSFLISLMAGILAASSRTFTLCFVAECQILEEKVAGNWRVFAGFYVCWFRIYLGEHQLLEGFFGKIVSIDQSIKCNSQGAELKPNQSGKQQWLKAVSMEIHCPTLMESSLINSCWSFEGLHLHVEAKFTP